MKINHLVLPGSLLYACGALLAPSLLFAAGPLTPPGPPAPLFKTLDEIEPRTPITSLPFAINQPGSYYLAGNLNGVAGQHGINIAANDVTIDLRGFALGGVAGSDDGIRTTGARTNIAILNGTIQNWGNDGIDLSSAFNCQLREIRTSNNAFEGMQVGSGGIVVGCTSRANGQDGIDAGIGCSISDCASSANSISGIRLSSGSTVSGCSVTSNTQDGILAGSDNRIVNNLCRGNGAGAGTGAGITVTGGDNRIEGNSATDNDMGLEIQAAGNLVAGNNVRSNTDNYNIAQGNQLTLLLSQIPESIDWPAAVVLAGSLTGVAARPGISIAANDVTIDFAGHSLIGVIGSSDGIIVSGNRTNITIRNGSVRHWIQDGVDASSAFNSLIENVNSSNNGLRGIAVGPGSAVKCANVRANNGAGIVANNGCRIVDSSASENKGTGIDLSSGSVLSNCSSFNNGGIGIDGNNGCTITGCTSFSNTGIGINASTATTVDRCSVSSGSTNGIAASNGSRISGCTIRANGGSGIVVTSDTYVFNNQVDGHTPEAGILATGSDNRIESNTLTDNVSRGIDVNLAGNLIVRNSVAGSTTPYDIVAGNTVGEIQAVINPVTEAVSAWANFRF